MGHKKLERFAELNTFKNVFQPKRIDLPETTFDLQGKWQSYFNNNNPIVAELGCGKGEYTVGLAQHYTTKNFIGVDIKGNRMWVGAKASLQQGLSNVAFLRLYIDHIEKVFGKQELDEIWITFPDPQPQESREKKRLTCPKFLNKYKTILKEDGILHLKTDSESLYNYTLETLQSLKYNIIFATDNLYKDHPEDPILGIKTYYETLFTEKGFSIKYIKFQLK